MYEWMYAQTGEKIVPGASGYASIGTLDFVYESLAEEKRMEEEIFGSVEVFID